MVEQRTENPRVASSILAFGTRKVNRLTTKMLSGTMRRLAKQTLAGVVQLVEHLLAKEKVTGSSPVTRFEKG